MHELSIVLNVVDMAAEQTRMHNASKVESIELEIGALAGIEMDAFDFAWKAAIPDTILEGAERIIHEIPAKAHCLLCDHEFEAEYLFGVCPNCGEYRNEIVQGREMRVKTLTVV